MLLSRHHMPKSGGALDTWALWLMHPCNDHTGRVAPVALSLDRSVPDDKVVKALRSLVTSVLDHFALLKGPK